MTPTIVRSSAGRPYALGRTDSPQHALDARWRLKDVLPRGYKEAIPDVVDYTANRTLSVPMDLNDQLGDCTAAAAAHLETAWSYFGRGIPVVPTSDQVTAFYSGSTGYVPGRPSTDQGGDIETVLRYWQATGLAGHKVASWFAVDPTDADEIRAALYLFGPLYIGFNVPKSALDAFDTGKVWDVVTRSPIEGGHCVTVNKAVKGGNYTFATWGGWADVTPKFWTKYVDEPVSVQSQEWINAQGGSPVGLDAAGLNAAITEFTGKPGPFVAPTPAPPAPKPTPTPPAPVPATGDASTLLADVKAAIDAQSAKIGAFLGGDVRHHGR